MVVTFEVSHLPIDWLKDEKANIHFMLVTPDVFHLEMSSWKDVTPWNNMLISVTDEVSQSEMFPYINSAEVEWFIQAATAPLMVASFIATKANTGAAVTMTSIVARMTMWVMKVKSRKHGELWREWNESFNITTEETRA